MFARVTAADVACPADTRPETVTVEAIYDGDTVRLTDGREIRFVGINTPEIGHDGEPDDPLARSARRALEAMIDAGDGRIGLVVAPEGHDHYGRVLAHPFTADGRNITAQLLERGLGWLVAIPPNLAHVDCYARAARAARRADRGVYDQPGLAPVAAGALGPDAGGFTVVTGRIERVGASDHAWWLDLGGLTLRLARDDLPYFREAEPRTWKGRRLRVQGWIYRVRDEPRMNLRHPATVEWMDERP